MIALCTTTKTKTARGHQPSGLTRRRRLEQATSARTDSKPRPRLAIVLSLADHIRLGHVVEFTFGQVLHLPYRKPAVIEYKAGVARIHSWKDALIEAWQHESVSNADCLDMLVLHRYALPNGALCLANRSGPHKWWSEADLARFLKGVTRKTFRARWRRWEEAGWVESRQPRNPAHRTERWLGKVPDEV
jgi:hypothetical protein